MLGLTYETKAKKKLIALRISSKEEVSRLKSSHEDEKKQLKDRVTALDVELSDAKMDTEISDELCSEFWADKQEMIRLVTVFEAFVSVASAEKERILGVVEEQSQTITELIAQISEL
jgi:hypothetical protein